jgi:hypothetical protein
MVGKRLFLSFPKESPSSEDTKNVKTRAGTEDAGPVINLLTIHRTGQSLKGSAFFISIYLRIRAVFQTSAGPPGP